MLPLILEIAGPALTPAERALFRDSDPAGYLLFARNCVDRAQLRALTDSLRNLAGRDLPILIDQEGGRCARLRPPEWPAFPAPARFAQAYDRAPITAMEAARLNALATALTLREVGITVACHPLLDVLTPQTHAVIGDRALGDDPLAVASLGRFVLDGLSEGGVAGVLKHAPGHGRASADSHAELPEVTATIAELERDLHPFRALADRARICMTAHIRYPAWDADRPATLSPTIIGDVIRGQIGFDGLLISDDIGMAALTGSVAGRGLAALAAGCDLVLYCSGDPAEPPRLAAALPTITAEASARLERALAGLAATPAEHAIPDLLARRDALLAAASGTGTRPLTFDLPAASR